MEVFNQNNECQLESFLSEFKGQVKVNQKPENSEKRGIIKSNTDNYYQMLPSMRKLANLCYNGCMTEYGIPNIDLPILESRLHKLEQPKDVSSISSFTKPKMVQKLMSKPTIYEYTNDLMNENIIEKLKSIDQRYQEDTKNLYKWSRT